MEEIKASGFGDYFVDHTTGVYPTAASGIPFSACALQVKGDIITDLHEDLAADVKCKFGQPPLLDNIVKFMYNIVIERKGCCYADNQIKRRSEKRIQ